MWIIQSNDRNDNVHFIVMMVTARKRKDGLVCKKDRKFVFFEQVQQFVVLLECQLLKRFKELIGKH